MSFYIRVQTLIIALLFVTLSSFLQVSPSVNSDYLIASLPIDENLLLKLTTLYFFSYAILQIPVGYILNIRNIEKIFTVSLFIVIIGLILYWLSTSSFSIGFSRLTIGAGCSTAYITAIFISTKYFSKTIIPLLIALTEIASGIGDYLAERPYLYILNNFGWNIANLIIICILLIILIYFLCLLKITKKELSNQEDIKLKSFTHMLKSIKYILKSSTNIAIFSYSFFTWGIIMTFAGYWAKDYYIVMHHYTIEMSLSLPEIYWISFLISALIVGIYVKTFKQAKTIILILSIFGLIAYTIMIIPIIFNYSLLYCITIFSGISSSGVVLAFFIIQHLVSSEDKGLAISINNFFIVLGGMIGQISFSKIILFNFDGLFSLNNDINPFLYSGLIMLIIWSILALISLLYFLRKIGTVKLTN